MLHLFEIRVAQLRTGHFMSSQTTYAPYVPNLAQFFHIYWSSYEFTFPNFVCSYLNGCRITQH